MNPDDIEAQRLDDLDYEYRRDTCFYCGEPLEDGLCSASCAESAEDEGRDIEDDNIPI